MITVTKIGKVKLPNRQRLLQTVDGAMALWARDVKKDYESTVATWTDKPAFKVTRRSAPSYIQYSVYTSSEKYAYVDFGTRPHAIAARRSPYLRYQQVYRAKTRPGSIRSRAGGKSGPWLVRKRVNHPGNEARKFTETIARKNRTALTIRISKALSRERFRL